MADFNSVVVLKDLDAHSEDLWDKILLSWDLQQGAYLEYREQRFEFMIRTIADHLADKADGVFTVLDLGTGPGSLAIRVLEYFDRVRVVAIDSDPLLLKIARETTAKYGDRCVVLEADFRDDSWVGQVEEIGFGKVSAAVSTTALHWLDPSVFSSTAYGVGQLMEDGAIFLNGDHLAYELDQLNLRRLAKADQDRSQAQALKDPSTVLWEQWWEEVEQIDALSEVVEARKEWLKVAEGHWGERKFDRLKSFSFQKSALAHAGFVDVDSIWQRHDDRILVGFRDVAGDEFRRL